MDAASCYYCATVHLKLVCNTDATYTLICFHHIFGKNVFMYDIWCECTKCVIEQNCTCVCVYK